MVEKAADCGLLHILFLSDTHLGFDAPERPRIQRRRRGEEFFRNYRRTLDSAHASGSDLVLHGGDLFYRSRVPDSLVAKVFKPLLEIADRGLPVILVPGNHERSQIRTTLFELHPNIHIFDRPRTYRFSLKGVSLAPDTMNVDLSAAIFRKTIER